jgi:hypothetical protein
MRHLHPLLFSLALLSSPAIEAQYAHGIKDPGAQMNQRCGECIQLVNSKPKEVQFAVFDDADGNVWFVITDARFLEELTKKGGYGFTVDIVPRDRYSCTPGRSAVAGFPLGVLMEPVYQSQLKERAKVMPDGSVAILLGSLPKQFSDQPHEYNLIILKNKYICFYNSFTNIQSFRWDLLNMGMFMDTLTYMSRGDTTKQQQVSSILKRKALHFTIPFEKNKSEYSAADLQPMYDSLRLTDFTIKSIDIEAYSSVEGPEARNIELQQKRAQSIVSALQSFQTPNIRTTVKASENWVEFLNDVALTPYSELAMLDKAEIKRRLTDPRVGSDLEPTLAAHRKALVSLELQRKDVMLSMPQEQLVKEFEQAIATKNLEQARKLQNAVFARIMDRELPSNFLDRLEVPVQREFVVLMTSRAAFKYFEDPTDAYETYLALQELERLMPTDGHVKYNLCVMRFHLLIQGEHAVEPEELERSIKALRNHGIEEPLVTRMLINYNILMAEVDMAKGEYARKDKRMSYIRTNYTMVPMEPADHLSLAQYFASYANYEDARTVLNPYLTEIDVDEDLLFYYLNLTIFDTEQTKKNAYRQAMLNAVNKNKPRFCGIFAAISEGGVSFQLLDDPYLLKTYCETCN